VLTAPEEMENAPITYSNEQERRELRQRVIRAGRTALELAQAQYRTGLADFLTVLDAERTLSEKWRL
jgi:multidrug efflux system outer membrane protein